MASPTAGERADALRGLRALHRRVDAQAVALAARHGDRLRCRRGCAACCRDGLTVFAVEAERISAAHAELLRDGTPHAPGACAFLDADGACRIYPDRPYVCRTQGLPLRWQEERADGRGVVERRDICPENEAGPPITSLPEEDCWLLGPFEHDLADLALRFAGDRTRIPLRTLFEPPPPDSPQAPARSRTPALPRSGGEGAEKECPSD